MSNRIHPVTVMCLLVALSVALAITGLAHGSEPSEPVSSTHAALLRMPPHKTDADESEIERWERLAEIARAIDAATEHRTERAWLIMTARRESGLARYVHRDEPRCREGHGGRCDGGRALGLWQQHGAERSLTTQQQAARAIDVFRLFARYCRERGRDWWVGGTAGYARGGSCEWTEAVERVDEMWRIWGTL